MGAFPDGSPTEREAGADEKTAEVQAKIPLRKVRFTEAETEAEMAEKEENETQRVSDTGTGICAWVRRMARAVAKAFYRLHRMLIRALCGFMWTRQHRQLLIMSDEESKGEHGALVMTEQPSVQEKQTQKRELPAGPDEHHHQNRNKNRRKKERTTDKEIVIMKMKGTSVAPSGPEGLQVEVEMEDRKNKGKAIDSERTKRPLV